MVRVKPQCPAVSSELECFKKTWAYHNGGQGDLDEVFFPFILQNLLLWGLFGEAKDSKGFIECKMSGPLISRNSLRKSVGVKSAGK